MDTLVFHCNHMSQQLLLIMKGCFVLFFCFSLVSFSSLDGLKKIVNEKLCFVSNNCINQILDQGRSYLNDDINIYMCCFQRSSVFSGDGGVIYVTGGTQTLNISNTVFYECRCSGFGGAISAKCQNSVLQMVCARNCSGSQDHFAILEAGNINNVMYLSMSMCSDSTIGFYPLFLKNGSQRFDNSNSSMNKAVANTGICIVSPVSFTSNRCSFSNNYASDRVCIEYYGNTGLISYINVVHNNSPNLLGVLLVHNKGSYTVEYSIFYMNSNTLLFIGDEAHLSVSHSFIYHEGLVHSGSIDTSNNNTNSQKNTYKLMFFQSQYCFADNPAGKEQFVNTIQHSGKKSFINAALFFAMFEQ